MAKILSEGTKGSGQGKGLEGNGLGQAGAFSRRCARSSHCQDVHVKASLPLDLRPSCISDICISIPNGSKITVKSNKENVMVGEVTTT